MDRYSIEFAPSVYRAFSKLPADAQRRLVPAIDALAVEPRPTGAKRLAAPSELWRVRVGAYRIVYAIEDALLVVLVVRIGHRRDVYRSI